MSQQLKEEIKTRTKEIYDLENRLQSLQIAQSAPVADGFNSAMDFIEATRDYHQVKERAIIFRFYSGLAREPPRGYFLSGTTKFA